jgi:hypothetical protein
MELLCWKNFMAALYDLDPELKIYIKGGATLGLLLLKSLIKARNFDKFSTYQSYNFLKDWDFICYSQSDVSIPDILDKYSMFLEGKKVKVVRYKTLHERLLINGESLIECSFHSKENLSDMELPLTTIKIPVTTHNIKIIFDTIEMFNSNTLDEDLLHNLFDNIEFIQRTCNDVGLFSVTNEEFDDGNLSNNFLSILCDYELEEKQFIISHMKQPDRLFLRLQKNINKSDKIREYGALFDESYDFVLDNPYIDSLVSRFFFDLKSKIDEIYVQHKEMLLLVYTQIDQLNEEIKFLNYLYEDTKNKYTYEDYLALSKVDSYDKLLHIDNTLAFDLLKSRCEKSVINKLTKFDERIALYDKHKQSYLSLTLSELKREISSHNKLLLNHVANVKVIYANIYNDYGKLFEGINLGRLVEIINKDSFTDEKVRLIFGDAVKGLRFKYVNQCRGYSDIISLFMKINKLCI